MPEHVVPMLARLSKMPPDEDDYGWEVKWDGVRAVVYSGADGSLLHARLEAALGGFEHRLRAAEDRLHAALVHHQDPIAPAAAVHQR